MHKLTQSEIKVQTTMKGPQPGVLPPRVANDMMTDEEDGDYCDSEEVPEDQSRQGDEESGADETESDAGPQVINHEIITHRKSEEQEKA